MTIPDALDAALAPWLHRAEAVVVDRLADAGAHAKLGDLATAIRRLVELRRALVGPKGSGVVGDARAEAYHQAHDDFDPEIHDEDRRLPTPEGVAVARTAAIGGRDASLELGQILEQARQDLVTAAASTGAIPDLAAWTAIDTWHAQHTGTIRSWARRTLSDGQIAIQNAIAHLRIREELR